MERLVWKAQDFPHLECCSRLLNLEGKNNHTFSAVESSIVELKSVFLRWLIEWSRVLGTTSMTSFTDLIDSLPFYCNSLHRHPV